MKLIIESGATKTSWRAICDDGSVYGVQTEGLSPTCLDVEHMQGVSALERTGERSVKFKFIVQITRHIGVSNIANSTLTKSFFLR